MNDQFASLFKARPKHIEDIHRETDWQVDNAIQVIAEDRPYIYVSCVVVSSYRSSMDTTEIQLVEPYKDKENEWGIISVAFMNFKCYLSYLFGYMNESKQWKQQCETWLQSAKLHNDKNITLFE